MKSFSYFMKTLTLSVAISLGLASLPLKNAQADGGASSAGVTISIVIAVAVVATVKTAYDKNNEAAPLDEKTAAEKKAELYTQLSMDADKYVASNGEVTSPLLDAAMEGSKDSIAKNNLSLPADVDLADQIRSSSDEQIQALAQAI